MNAKKLTYPCPMCKKMADISEENKARPFCSERCKLIDLGKWASEDYRVESGPDAQDKEPSDESE